MAFINLLHNGYQGKLGETVGQKWKNQRTVRTYNAHNNSKSEAQLEQRDNYRQIIKDASLAYPYNMGLEYVRTKGMNKFNAFTRFLWNMSQGVDNYEYAGGIFRKPSGPQFKAHPFIRNNDVWINLPQPQMKTYGSAISVKVVAFFIDNRNGIFKAPVIDKSITRLMEGILYQGNFPSTDNPTYVMQIGAASNQIPGSILQFIVKIDGKEYPQKPIIFLRDLNRTPTTLYTIRREKIIQQYQ